MNIMTAILIFLMGVGIGGGALCLWMIKCLREIDQEVDNIVASYNNMVTKSDNLMKAHNKVLSDILSNVSDAIGVEEVTIPVWGKINLKDFEFETEEFKLKTRENKQ